MDPDELDRMERNQPYPTTETTLDGHEIKPTTGARFSPQGLPDGPGNNGLSDTGSNNHDPAQSAWNWSIREYRDALGSESETDCKLRLKRIVTKQVECYGTTPKMPALNYNSRRRIDGPNKHVA